MYITTCIVLIWDRAVPWALSASSVCPVLIIIINDLSKCRHEAQVEPVTKSCGVIMCTN